MLSLKYLQDFSLEKVYAKVQPKRTRSSGQQLKMNYSVSEAIDVCLDLVSEVKDGNERIQNILAFHPKFNLGDALSSDEIEDLTQLVDDFEPVTFNLPNGEVIMITSYRDGKSLGFKSNDSILFAYTTVNGSVVSDGVGLVKAESGRYIPLADVCTALAQSLQESKVISHAIDMSVTNQASAASFFSSLSMYSGQFSAKTMELVQQLAAVLNYNDPRGLLQLIANYFSMYAGASDNSNNTISLSSIDWKVETGLIISVAGLISTVAQFVGTIGAFFNVAAGFIISSIGSFIAGVFNAGKSDATYPEFNTQASSPTLAVPIFQNRRPILEGIGSKVKDMGYVRYHTLGLVCHAWIDPLDGNYWYSEGFLDLRYKLLPDTSCCGVTLSYVRENDNTSTALTIPAYRWISNGLSFDGQYSYPSGYYDGKVMPYNWEITVRVYSALLFTMIGLLDPFIAHIYEDGDDVETPIRDILMRFDTLSIPAQPSDVNGWIKAFSFTLTYINENTAQRDIDNYWANLINQTIPLIRESFNTAKDSGFVAIDTTDGDRILFDEWESNMIGSMPLCMIDYPVVRPQGSFTHFVKPAAQTLGSWTASTILSSTIVVATAAAAAFTVFKVKRAVTSFLNKKSLKVKAAEYAYTQNPTPANADAYSKALRKQKSWQSLLGRADPAIMNNNDTSQMPVQDSNITSSLNNLQDSSESIIRLIKP